MVLTLVVLAAQWGSRQPAPTEELNQSIMQRIATILRYTAFVPDVDFTNWEAVAAEHQGEYQVAQTAEQYADRVSNILRGYGVSHIGIVPPGEAIGEATETFGFDSMKSDGKWVVTRVFAGTEAEQAGLHAGLVLESKVRMDDDRIVVSFYDDSHALQAKSIHHVKAVLRMPPELVELDKDASVLEISDFAKGYDPGEMDDLMKRVARVPYLVIDLRGNVGGFPRNACQFLGYFIDGGTRFGATISRDSMAEYLPNGADSSAERTRAVNKIKADDAMIVKKSVLRYPGHVALLVDGRTRSTGEVVATALRDWAAVPIFGTPSSGQVLEMMGEDLPGGYTLYFPERDYWTAKGERLEGHPIQPDFPSAKDSEEAGPTLPPLQLRAARWLRLNYPRHGNS